MNTIAQYRYARSSSQKIRLVANLIRGKQVAKALEILTYTNKKSSYLIKKVLESAIANAEHNNNKDIDVLKIKKIFIDVGPSIKRIKSRAKGRVNHILKRTSHITIILDNY